MGQKEIKGHCIICHADDVVLSDEHVIPEAIGGYLHSYKVCKICNSNLGSQVDRYLLDHFFMVAARQEHHLKGYSNTVPHPLTGDGVLDTGEKIQVEEVDGMLITHLLPSKPEVSTDGRQVKIIVDKNDEKLIPKIQNKVFKKLGIDDGSYRIESNIEVHEISHPIVKMQRIIDLKNYKIGLLKIAYEFCVEQIPEYENDPKGKLYANILYEGNLDRIDEAIIDGRLFYDPYDSLLSLLIDYSKKKRHYIVLSNINGKLCCMVRLFDKFCQTIEMSDKAYGTDNSLLVIAINDFEEHKCEMFTLEQLVTKVNHHEGMLYKFVPSDDEKMRVLCDKYGDKVGFQANKEGYNLVFNRSGVPLTTDANLLHYIPESSIEEKEMPNGVTNTIYHIPDGLFFKVAPDNDLIQLSEIIEVSLIKKY